MNRRDFLTISGSSVMFAGMAGRRSAAGSDHPTIVHIIRIQFASGVSPAMRAQMTRTINRFKQIHIPEKFIVGKDVAASGVSYDFAQVSFLTSETAYHDYFYAPIHLAADREAFDSREKPFAAISSFDTIHGGDADLQARLNKILSAREAKYKATDTRPTSPPAPDRPEDQKWNHGSAIYRVTRVDLSSMGEEQKKARFAAMDRLKQIKGVQQVFYGTNAKRKPSDRFTHAVLVQLASEDAYQAYLASPIHDAERHTGLQLPREAVLTFDVIDPNNNELAERLRKLHSETGA